MGHVGAGPIVVRSLSWRTVVGAPAWLVVGLLGLVSAFHMGQIEPDVAVLVLMALTPWVYMLAWVTAAFGLWTRRRALAVCSVALVALQLWWVLPDFDPLSQLVRLPPGEVQLTMFSDNVTWTDYNLTAIGHEILERRPSFVALEEPNSTALDSLAATGALSPYHYRYVSTNGGADGLAVYSVYPLSGGALWFAGPLPQYGAWVELPGHVKLRVEVVHLRAPVVGAGQPGLWAREMADVRDHLARQPRPLVALGDFGGTVYNPPFDALLRLGLRDAADVAGQGWRMTWPRSLWPVVRIDHALISSGVSLEGYSLGTGAGTDHRPLLVTLSVGPGPG